MKEVQAEIDKVTAKYDDLKVVEASQLEKLKQMEEELEDTKR